MQSGLGKNSPSPPPTRPGNLPFQGKALTGWHPGNPVPGCQRGYPPPLAHFLLPSPSPSGCSSSHSGFIIVPTPVPLLPGKSLQPGSLAGTCCLLVGANIAPYLHSVSLCQGQTTQGLDASQGQPESLHPTAWVARQARHPCPTVDCTQARREVRASPASMQENARTLGWHKGKNNIGPSLQPVDTIISATPGENRVRRRQLLWDPCLPQAVPPLRPGLNADFRSKIQQCS